MALLLVAGRAHATTGLSLFILHSYSQEYAWTKGEHEGFMRRIRADVPGSLSVSVEYLDTKRVRYTAEYADAQAAYIASKYRGFEPDAVYVTDDNALLFALSHLSRIFPPGSGVLRGDQRLWRQV